MIDLETTELEVKMQFEHGHAVHYMDELYQICGPSNINLDTALATYALYLEPSEIRRITSCLAVLTDLCIKDDIQVTADVFAFEMVHTDLIDLAEQLGQLVNILQGGETKETNIPRPVPSVYKRIRDWALACIGVRS